MRFYIDNLILWLNDGTKRTLKFEEDKINIITGNSKTGKTAILEIIDYCLCGSNETVVISHEHIGENVLWYGIRFVINEKTYTIARGAILEGGMFSADYYFSQTGDIPEMPCVKMGEQQIKSILENEFLIDDEVTVSYGGRSIKRNARLSFRYFLMYNTLSKDVVDNGKLFFDKLNIERYRDVWFQIFDLSLGVIDLNTITFQKKIEELRQSIFILEAEKKKENRKKQQVESQVDLLIKHAKENKLIDESLQREEAFSKIREMISEGAICFSSDFSVQQKFVELQEKREAINLQIVKLKRFKKSYSEYKNSLREDADALQPINYIQSKFGDKVDGEYRQFLNILSKDLEKVKGAISNKRPFEFDVERKIRELNKELKNLDSELSTTAHVDYTMIPTAQKLVSLGEIKAEYKSIDFSYEYKKDYDEEIENKNAELIDLESQYTLIEDRRELVIETLNEYIQMYIEISKDALDEYGNYCARFDYKNQRLTLKKNKSASIAQISSSSDHLFMHLCMFAGIHHLILNEAVNYVPSYLIIDQPSRPYFNNSEYDYKDSKQSLSKKDDWSKVKNIFTLWDKFFTSVLEQKKHFQLIILEHVSEEAWSGCENVHLVDVFDGVENALIPLKLKNDVK
jgi:Chromosome segregation ATPases